MRPPGPVRIVGYVMKNGRKIMTLTLGIVTAPAAFNLFITRRSRICKDICHDF